MRRLVLGALMPALALYPTMGSAILSPDAPAIYRASSPSLFQESALVERALAAPVASYAPRLHVWFGRMAHHPDAPVVAAVTLGTVSSLVALALHAPQYAATLSLTTLGIAIIRPTQRGVIDKALDAVYASGIRYPSANGWFDAVRIQLLADAERHLARENIHLTADEHATVLSRLKASIVERNGAWIFIPRYAERERVVIEQSQHSAFSPQRFAQRAFRIIAAVQHQKNGAKMWANLCAMIILEETESSALPFVSGLLEEVLANTPELADIFARYHAAERQGVLDHLMERIMLQHNLNTTWQNLSPLLAGYYPELKPMIPQQLEDALTEHRTQDGPFLRAQGDALGYALSSNQEWLGWHLLKLIMGWEDCMESALALGYEEAYLVVAALYPSHLRQSPDPEDRVLYPAILDVVLKTLERSLNLLEETGAMPGTPLDQEARRWALVLFNLLHINPDPLYAFPRGFNDDGRLGDFSYIHYREFISEALRGGSLYKGGRDPERIIERALGRYRELLNPGGPLPLVLQFADHADDGIFFQTGIHILELFFDFYERRGGPKHDGTDPTLWDIATGNHPDVQAFMRERQHAIPREQLQLLTFIRDQLLSGDWFEFRGASEPAPLRAGA